MGRVRCGSGRRNFALWASGCQSLKFSRNAARYGARHRAARTKVLQRERNQNRRSRQERATQRCEHRVMPGHRRLLCATLIAAQTYGFVPSPPELTALGLKETLNKKGFVRIPGAEFRALLRWKGAKEEDLQLIESGAVHADVRLRVRSTRFLRLENIFGAAQVATDEGAMAFRQSAAHRLVATGPAPFVPAQRPAVTKIPAKEVLARRPARQRRLHGSVARRSRPPPRPRSGPSGPAIASGRSRRRPTRRRRSPSPSPRSSASSCPTRTRRSTASTRRRRTS